MELILQHPKVLLKLLLWSDTSTDTVTITPGDNIKFHGTSEWIYNSFKILMTNTQLSDELVQDILKHVQW